MSDNVHVSQFIDIVFDGPPSHDGGRFVEVENEHGQSINTGEWIKPEENEDYDGYVDQITGKAPMLWRLRLKVKPGLNALGRLAATIRAGAGFEQPVKANLSEKLMLGVSELSEALEEHRDGNPLHYYVGESLDGPNKPEGVLVEIADCVIRCFDMMQGLIDEATDNGEVVPSIEDVIMEKMNYNSTRGNNKHGRNF